MSDAGYSATGASDSLDKVDSSASNADTELGTLTSSADAAAGALDGVTASASGVDTGTSSTGSTSTLGNLFTFLTGGGDLSNVFASYLGRAITKYVPKGIKALANIAVASNHEGTDYVTKANSWLDDMLGLGNDETARVLKVGEAIIPDYANNISLTQVDKPFSGASAINHPNTSNISNSNSSLNIDMGDLDISGIDSEALRNELQSIKNEATDEVYSTLYRYIKVGGYRNVRRLYA